MHQIIVIDDHPIVRKGIATLLNDFPGGSFACGEAAGPEEAEAKIRRGRYTLALLDISLGAMNGLDLLPRLLGLQPEMRVLVLSMHPEREYALRALALGAAGYVTKETGPAELIAAIKRVLGGGRYISSSLAEALIDELLVKKEPPPHEQLSERELQVLRMIASGSSPSTIADVLCLSVKTVSTYRTRILRKLNVNSTAEIIRYGIENGFVT